jgi:YebC/PmpR family DNA-binding regulatory protein
VLTDNKNRTVGEIRFAFSRAGGALGEAGCVGWMFDKKGILSVAKSAAGEDQLMEYALEAGADDVIDSDDVWEVSCDPRSFHDVRSRLEKKVKCDAAEIQMVPKSQVKIQGKEAEQMIRLLESLEELDDVLNVWANCDIADEAGK